MREELKAGKEPVAMPSEKIANFVGKLFPQAENPVGLIID